MSINEVKPYLVNKLKQNHCLWSFNEKTIKDIPDDILIELVMIHLDLDDIDKLFQIYNFKEMKKVWLQNIVAQGDIYYQLNVFFAWYYFHIKKPQAYVKSMSTRFLNKRLGLRNKRIKRKGDIEHGLHE